MGWDATAWGAGSVWHSYQCALDLYNALKERYKAVKGIDIPGAALAAPTIWHTESWITAFDLVLLAAAKANGVSEMGATLYPAGSQWAFVDHTEESSGTFDTWIAANSNAPPPRVGQSTDAGTWAKLLAMAGEASLKTTDTWHYRDVLDQRKTLVSALSHCAHFVSVKAVAKNRLRVDYVLTWESPGQSKLVLSPAVRLAKIEEGLAAAEAAATTDSGASFAYDNGFAGKYSTITWGQDRNDGSLSEWYLYLQAEAKIGNIDMRFGSALAADVDLYFRKTADKSADDMTWFQNSPGVLRDSEHDTFSHTFDLPTSVATYMSRYTTKNRSAGAGVEHLISDQTLALEWPTMTDPNIDGTDGSDWSVRGYNIGNNLTNSSYNYLATNLGVQYPLCVAVIKYAWDYA
jgi:hypothetical protein